VIFEYEALGLPHIVRRDAAVAGKLHWVEPEFAFAVGIAHMDVGRFVGLMGVKVKAKRAATLLAW